MYDKQQNSNNLAYFKKRLYFFVVLVAIFFLTSLAKLIEYQILKYDELAKKSESKNLIKQTVYAARGDIIDRNGVLLATSNLKLSLIFDSLFPMAKAKDNDEIKLQKNIKGNEIIFNLLKILQNNNLTYENNFPISLDAPYRFLDDKKTEETKLKAALNQQPYATPTDILNLLIEKYDIKGYNESDAVKIAAMRANMLLSNFSQNNIFTIIDSIEPEYVEKFIGSKQNLTGVSIAETSDRLYPCEEVAAHIVGNVGPIYSQETEKLKEKNYEADAIVGKFGIEKECEDHLRPYNGKLTTVLKNNKIKKYYEKGEEPKPGKTVRLTIDYEFQKRIQIALDEHIKKTSSSNKGGAAVVLDVTTGEVLAIVSIPTYNLNTYHENFEKLANAPNKPLINQALGTFRPGSAFKPFIAAAGILSKKIDPSLKCRCVPGAVLFPRMGCIQEHHKGSHILDIYDAIRCSCNNYFYNVAKIMDIETIDEYAPYFGFATDTGLEIYNPDGKVTNPADYAKRGQPYRKGFTYQTGIGQAGVAVTQLQLAISQVTIANRGKRLAAHIIKSIESFDSSQTFFETQPKVLSQLDSSNQAWDVVIKGMKLMAKTRPPLSKLDIATKSGSPEYSDINKKLTNAVGVGFFPTKKPEIAMSVFVHDAKFAVDFLGKIVGIWENLKQEREAKI